MPWPTQSADLSPIELMWDEVDRKVRVNQATSTAYHWQRLQKSWVEQFSVYFSSLVERMPTNYEPVIAAKGGHFDE